MLPCPDHGLGGCQAGRTPHREYLLRLFDSPDAEQDRIVDLGFELLVRESTAPATRPTKKAKAR